MVNRRGTQSQSKIFLLGNSRSLKNFDFHRLNGLPTIGMNAAYRHWERINWYPTYYSCMDTTVTLSHAEQIYQLIQSHEHNGIQLFLLRENILERYPDLAHHEAVLFLEQERQRHPILQTQHITTGAQSALWAAYLGYTQIFLLGVDLNYVEQIPEAKHVEGMILEISQTPKENPNYFFDDYQQIGDRYHIPNPNGLPIHLQTWLEAKTILENTGHQIINCNTASHLRLFPFFTVEDALAMPEHRPSPSEEAPQKAHQTIPASRLSRLRHYFSGGSGILAALAILLQAISFGDYRFAWFFSLLAFSILLVMLGNSIMNQSQRTNKNFENLQSQINEMGSIHYRTTTLENNMSQIESNLNNRLAALEEQVNALKDTDKTSDR